MQRQHLKMLTASLALLLVGVFVLVVVLLVGGGGGDRGTRDNPNGATTDTDALSDFCCSFDLETCTTNSDYCGFNQTLCQDECKGHWVSAEFLTEQTDSGALSDLPTQACLPAVDARAVVQTLNTTLSSSVVRLERSAQLCTLWQVNADRTRIIPVARSYRGHGWEAYATNDIFPQLAAFACDPKSCVATILPALLPGHHYELASFDHELPARDELARFLEQASFGPTREALNDFEESSGSVHDKMVGWIKDQQEIVPLTSHREYFRERVNGEVQFPSAIGLPTQPCEAGARYRRSAFVGYDSFKPMDIVTDPATGRKVLYVDGQARTVLQTTELHISNNGERIPLADGSYKICGTQKLRVQVPDQGCNEVRIDGATVLNPTVFFDADTPPTNPVVQLDGYGSLITPNDWQATAPIEHPNCDLVPPQRGLESYTMIGTFQGTPYLFSPRQRLERNTLLEPMMDGGAKAVDQTRLEDFEVDDKGRLRRQQVKCSNVHLSFLNQDFCKLTTDPNACSPRDPPDVSIDLSEDTLEKIFEATGVSGSGARYVYAIQGLRQDDGFLPYNPPCTPGETSRWIPSSSCGQNSIQIETSTNSTIAELVAAESADPNPFLRDITFPVTGTSCHPNDASKYGFTVEVNGECWENVHQMHLQVFDFTNFVTQHPGGPEKIVQFANSSRLDRFRITFPSWHPMSRFHGVESSVYRTEIGRYGDSVRFSDLPEDLQQEDVAVALGGVAAWRSGGPTLVCGSAGEVPNYVDGSASFSAVSHSGGRFQGSGDQKRTVWLSSVLGAQDALRQRVAWALSQILVISAGSIGATESVTAFYDIFVRHAFGNYRDILKEVSYSPLMAEMLTYLENKSTDHLWQTRRRVEFADENYAREIMQLFSIGLVKLNIDGTAKRNADGSAILTYTNDDITEYARLWTGLRKAQFRGNIEGLQYNDIDPMRLNPSWRDSFPKLGLDRKYIGDGLPLCSDLPDKHFLKAGATYILLGSNPTPQFHEETESLANDINFVRPSLDVSGSALYAKLCDAEGGHCRYQSRVVLDTDLTCFGIECDIQAPRVIEVGSGIFYEYLRVPCALQAFYSDARSVQSRWRSQYACEDPRQQTGAYVCCGLSDSTEMRFSGERVSFHEAQQRCSEEGAEVCGLPESPKDLFLEYWSTVPCSLQAKIDLDGTVAIVHSAPIENGEVMGSVRDDTKSFFFVVWEDSIDTLVTDYDETCGLLGCARDPSDNLCLCDVSISESHAFETAPTREQALNELHFGAFSPDSYFGQYQSIDFNNGVTMHSNDGSFSQDTIFEVTDENGVRHFLKNLRSDVVVGSNGSKQLKFRNPTHIISIHGKEKRDVQYEIDAALDHYFYHPNTAPFLAVRFAQRFGISNPSPRYVSNAAMAFRTGLYIDHSSGTSFGAGHYGDLGALVAALLLDREARSTILDADPAHGSYFEPFLRLVRVMKSLEFETKSESGDVNLANTQNSIGQAAHTLPDVFSFFLPEFQPSGPIGSAGLVSPESEVLTAPQLVHLLNGLLSLVKYGLDTAFGGFAGEGVSKGSRTLGDFSSASGYIKYHPNTFTDASEAVDELATLLTSGRLAQEKRELLVSVFEGVDGTIHEKSIHVQQLILTSPEFNTNGLSRSTADIRPLPLQRSPSGTLGNYKALVQLFLNGGMDSYNVLVPQECSGTNSEGTTVDLQYRSVRGELALTPEESSILISTNPEDEQPCTTWAIHPDISILKDLYDDGDLVFIANAGQVDSSKITKESVALHTVSTLFGHNTMQKEAKVIDPFRTELGTGALGRLSQVLTARGLASNTISIQRPSEALTPDPDEDAPVPMVVSSDGVTVFAGRPKIEADFPLEEISEQLNTKTDLYSNMFGETWSGTFSSGTREAKFLNDILGNTTISQQWNKGDFNRPLQTISRLIQTRGSRQVNRDIFYTNAGAWDHHNSMKEGLSSELMHLEAGLRGFVAELKSMGVWNNTVVMVTSEFGRTLTLNSREGTDHGWGGNYFLLGGGVRGGHIHGKYPSDLTTTGPQVMRRGRVIPSTSWDSIWHGIFEWMGAETAEELRDILPNIDNTYGNGFTAPLKASDLFV